VSDRVIVAVLGGPHGQRRAVVEPGRAIRVGRSEMMDLALPQDAGLSAAHFELRWDGTTCAVEDLGSAKGTELNGARVSKGEVAPDGWIRAGTTDFSVSFEAHTPPDAVVTATPVKESVLARLRAEADKGSLFAVLDAARDPRVQVILREAVDEYGSLYEGMAAETMAEVAPYLVKLGKGSRLLPQLVHEGWGRAWGVFLVCQAPHREVRAQLRRHLMVKGDDDEVLYFRFYDPRVLTVFAPTSTARQREELFGPIDRFVCEGSDGELSELERSGGAATGRA
jgi:Domain of unknown function (DUF4123)/Inner membrane component of T3SS, cytoplasmic domain